MNVNPNIDELLTGFIDGELSARQQNEVQRMVSHEPQVARRLRQLQNSKMLISSLPPAEAPANMLEQIKSSLERRIVSDRETLPRDAGRGARHLLIRKVFAAAAMTGLVVVLATVVYTIVGPGLDSGVQRPFVRSIPQPTTPSGLTKRGANVVAASEFWGRLELKTDAMRPVSAFINRAIEDNGLGDYAESSTLPGRTVFSLSCSRDAVGPFLSDLAGIWQRFSSATLFVETEHFGRPVAVNAVTPQQTAQIVNQAGFSGCLEAARDFAVLNSLAELTPGREVLALAGNTGDIGADLTAIPKPVLTWNRKPAGKVAAPGEGKPKVNLTIVLVGSE